MIGKYKMIKIFHKHIRFNRLDEAYKILKQIRNKKLLTKKESIELENELDFAYIKRI